MLGRTRYRSTLHQAAATGDRAALASEMKRLPLASPLFLLNHPFDLGWAIAECHPHVAGDLADKLRAAQGQKFSAMLVSKSLAGLTLPGMRCKVLSVLASAGFNLLEFGHDISLAAQIYGEKASQHRTYLDELSRSNHGRLKLHSLEPSLEDLLARPWWKTFHGRSCDRFPGDQKIWQRFIHSRREDAALVSLDLFILLTCAGSLLGIGALVGAQ